MDPEFKAFDIVSWSDYKPGAYPVSSGYCLDSVELMSTILLLKIDFRSLTMIETEKFVSVRIHHRNTLKTLNANNKARQLIR